MNHVRPTALTNLGKHTVCMFCALLGGQMVLPLDILFVHELRRDTTVLSYDPGGSSERAIAVFGKSPE